MATEHTVAEVEEILARARRLRDGVRAFKGEGATWEYTFPDGITEHYTIAGVMPIERLRDDVSSLVIWLWSTKDYLKRVASARGRGQQNIENLVDRTPALCLLADVANKLKHGELTRRRTTYDPSLGSPEFKSRHGAARLSVSAEGVTIEPTDPAAIEVSYPILDASGNVIADAIVLLQSAIGYWEKALSEL
jgi:hypothetical protein